MKDLPDQGKMVRCFQDNKVSSTHGWCYNGTGIRFCDWRFIHRARTNLYLLMMLRVDGLMNVPRSVEDAVVK